jgi:hypothetical protein
LVLSEYAATALHPLSATHAQSCVKPRGHVQEKSTRGERTTDFETRQTIINAKLPMRDVVMRDMMCGECSLLITLVKVPKGLFSLL